MVFKHRHVSTMACYKRCRCVDINFTGMIIMLPYCLCRHADTYICMEEYADVSSCIKLQCIVDVITLILFFITF